MKTKTKFLAFDDKEFDTENEVLLYEQGRALDKNRDELRKRINKVFLTSNPGDCDTKEHCVITGRLCNTYEQGVSGHNGDYYRAELKKVVNPNYTVFGACMCEEKALEFVEGFEKLMKKLKS